MYGVEASHGVLLRKLASFANEILCYFELIQGLPILVKRLNGRLVLLGWEHALYLSLRANAARASA